MPGRRDKGGAGQGGETGGFALYFSLSLYFCISKGVCFFDIALYFSMLCMFVFVQVAVLSQSTGRVASSSEQYGAVQQEARVATAIEVIPLNFSTFLIFIFFR